MWKLFFAVLNSSEQFNSMCKNQYVKSDMFPLKVKSVILRKLRLEQIFMKKLT